MSKKALLLEMIGEDAVIEGIDFDFEQSTYLGVFGGTTITITPGDKLISADKKYSDCVLVHCTDEEIKKKGYENILAAILFTPTEEVPMIYGKALVMRKIAGSASGFGLFEDSEINELIDAVDSIAREYN